MESLKAITITLPVSSLDGLAKLQRRRYCTRTTLIREGIAEFIRQQTFILNERDAEMREHFSKEKARAKTDAGAEA
jgi:predicted transcriptional regulator